MSALSEWKEFDRNQRSALIASFLGWTLDAFDFFLMVFMLGAISKEFGADIKAVAVAITLTLAMRPLGALVFGVLADRFGRRPVLMIDILLFSVLELASAFAPSLVALLVLRTVFGFAMGGEWGLGASLTMETIPPKARGLASGILQTGYPFGYLLASVVYGLLFDRIGWRGMFMVGVLPALLVLFIRRNVQESPAWNRMRQQPRQNLATVLKKRWPLFIYVVVLMTAFNLFSHGTQDLYPTFLQVQHGFDASTTGTIAIVYNLGALCGGMFFGAISERIGRRRAIAAAALLALPAIPLWAFSSTWPMFALGGFVMQFMIQGAWGIVPAHLNELSPPAVRAILPGFAYQLGNLAMARMGPFQAGIAEAHGNDYAFVLSWTVGIVAVVLAIVTLVGREAKDAVFTN